MKLRHVLPLLLLATPSAAGSQTPDDRAAVTAAIDRWDRSWRIKDPELGSRDYSDDAQWVNAFGHRRTGRAAIQSTLKEVFALPFVAAGNSNTLGHDVRFLSEDIAVVATKVERKGQQAASGEELGTRHTSHLRVFQKRDGRWAIISHLISDARDTARPRH